MRSRHRLLSLLVVLLLIAGVKFGQQLYRWHAFGEERTTLVRLEADLEEAAIGIVSTQLRADSLRRRIEVADSGLVVARGQLDRLERQVLRSDAPDGLARDYRNRLEEYNGRVEERNLTFREWRSEAERNHAHVGRYNAVVDSIRAAAARMGELYYPIRTPAEIASRHGLIEGVD